MSAISRTDAIDRLIREVDRASGFEIADYYSELFPDSHRLNIGPSHLETSRKTLKQAILNGLLDEQLVDLWNVAFPNQRCLYFDEGELHLQVRSKEPVSIE